LTVNVPSFRISKEQNRSTKSERRCVSPSVIDHTHRHRSTNEIDGDEENFNNTLSSQFVTLSLFGGGVLMKIQKVKWLVPLMNIVLPK
jgi:hypothetical protein